MSDYRDLVIEDLATEAIESRERIVSLEQDVAVYRELTTASFDALRSLTVPIACCNGATASCKWSIGRSAKACWAAMKTRQRDSHQRQLCRSSGR